MATYEPILNTDINFVKTFITFTKYAVSVCGVSKEEF